MTSLRNLVQTNRNGILNTLSLSAMIIASGCGKTTTQPNNVVTNAQVSAYTSAQGDQWVEAVISLNTGNYPLAGITLPITDPKNMTKQYGTLSIAPTLCGIGCNKGDLTVAVDLSSISKSTPIPNPTLPNGTPLPLGGLSTATVVGMPVDNTNAMIYYAFAPNTAILGTAIPFSALNPAGQYAAGADIFFPIQFPNVDIDAGMFFGANVNTTGVGVFIDVLNVINNTPAPSPSPTAELAIKSSSASHQSEITMETVRPSQHKENAIYQKLYELSIPGPTLKLE